jgi:glutamine synthetase
VRNPDPSCNPYLGLAVILKAGLDGIKNQIAPPDPVEQNIFEMNLADRKKTRHPVPARKSYEALDELGKDEIIKEPWENTFTPASSLPR